MLRVQELLKRELGVIIQRDYQFDGVLVTINDVTVAPNLRNGTVYFGVIGDSSAHHKIQRILNKDHGAIQKKMTARVVLKYTPQLRFCFDDSVERGVRTLSVLEEVDELPLADPEDDEEVSPEVR